MVLRRVPQLTLRETVVMEPKPLYDAGMNRVGEVIGYGFDPQTGQLGLRVRARFFRVGEEREEQGRLEEILNKFSLTRQFMDLVKLTEPPREFTTRIVNFVTDDPRTDLVAGVDGLQMSAIWDYTDGSIHPFYRLTPKAADEVNAAIRRALMYADAVSLLGRDLEKWRSMYQEMAQRVAVLLRENAALKRSLMSMSAELAKAIDTNVKQEVERMTFRSRSEALAGVLETKARADQALLTNVEEIVARAAKGPKKAIEVSQEIAAELASLKRELLGVVGVKLTTRDVFTIIRQFAAEHPELFRNMVMRLRAATRGGEEE